MIDVVYEPNEDLFGTIVPDGQPAGFDREDETAAIEVCDFCDLSPCGCGG